MIVHIPSPLRHYTEGVAEVDVSARSLSGLLRSLDRDHPGLRFRILDEQGELRTHIRLCVNGEATYDLERHLEKGDTIHIITALSGG